MRTVKNVALGKDDENDTCYHVMVADERVEPFIIESWQVVELNEELVEGLSWRAEVQMVNGLVPYLKAYGRFDLDVTENGFSVNTSRLKGEATEATENASND